MVEGWELDGRKGTMTAAIPEASQRGPLYRGWFVAIAITAVSFAQVAFFNPVLGVLISPLQDEFGWSRGAIAGALSVGTLAGAAASPIVGPLVDRYGARWFIVAALGVMAVCLVLLAFVDQMWQFYGLYGVGRALVTGIINLAITVTVSNWFIRNRGRANALALTGTRLGMALMPMVVLFFVSVASWRWAFGGLAALVLVVGVAPTWAWVRRRPEDIGLMPDGDVQPLETDGSVREIVHDEHWTVREAVRTKAFWLLLFGTSQLMLVGGATNLSMAPHIEDNGLGRDTAVAVVTVWAISGIVGGLIGGEIRQRVSVRYALPAVLVFSAIGLLWLIFVSNVWMAFAFAVFHGTAFGAQLPLNQTSFPDYFGRYSVGAIRGVTAPLQFGLNAVGPLVASVAFDRSGSYDAIFGVFVGLLLLGAVLILLAAPPRKRAGYS